MNAKTNKTENQVQIIEAQNDVMELLKKYFNTGNIEHHIGLLSNAIQEIIQKGANDTDESLDNPFAYSRRYIRESVYDLTELQKFLLSLHVVYSNLKHHNEGDDEKLCA